MNAAREMLPGDPTESFQTLQWLLRYPAPELTGDEKFREAFELFAEIAKPIAGDDFSAMIAGVAARPRDVKHLYSAGYDLIEADLPAIAATVLARADRESPGREDIISELVSALERDGMNHAARDVLLANPTLLESGFLCRYLLVFNAILSGRLEIAREHFAVLDPGSNSDFEFMRGTVAAMLARVDALHNAAQLDEKDLRGWDFVVNASLLLHVAEEGFEEGMRGRFAYTQDSFERCRAAIERLRLALEAARFPVETLVFLPDRSSEILGLAAGELLGADAKPWSEGNMADAQLVVAYDLNDLNDEGIYESLRYYRPGQALWAHAREWTRDFPIAEDITTYMYQYNAPPWEGGLSVNDQGEATESAPMSEPPDELAEKIVALEPEIEDLSGVEELKSFAARFGEIQLRSPERDGGRSRRFLGSPVTSNRFV